MKQSIDITIASKFIASGINAAKQSMAALAGKVKSAAAAIGGNLMNIKAGFDMAAGAIKTFVSVLSKGMEFERMTIQFKSLTGSMELARAHMKDLQDLGRTPPFSLEQFAAASVAMLKMTGGMAGFKHEMEIVGDLAAATGNDIATVGRAFGLAYQVIRDGQDFGRAGQQLYSLGIMTKAQVAEFAELSKSATDNMAVWEKLQEVFNRYRGAMAETEATTKGLTEAIQGEATVAMTNLSTAISESAKPALEGLLGYLRRINEDGTIEDWADTCVDAFSRFMDGARPVLGFLSKVVGGAYKTMKGQAEAVARGIGGFAGALMGGGSLSDAWHEGVNGVKEGWNYAWDSDGSQAAEREEKKQSRRAAKAASRAEEAAKAEAEAKARIEEDMARAKAEREKKQAEEAAKKAAEAKKKEEERIAKTIAAEEERLAKEREWVQNKMARDLLNEQIEGARAAHDARMKQLDEEKRKAEDAARVWEDAAARARESAQGGGGFGKWNAGERDRERDEARAKRKQENALKQAKKRRDDLLARKNLGKGFWNEANEKELAKINNYVDYLSGDNPANAEIERIEKEKNTLITNLKTTVESIQTQLSSLGL